MRLCFDATRFGFGLVEAVEFAAARKLYALEYSFEPFPTTGKSSLDAEEKKYFKSVHEQCKQHDIELSCLRLNLWLDTNNKTEAKNFRQMCKKLGQACQAAGCNRLLFKLKPHAEPDWVENAAAVINPVIQDLLEKELKLVLSIAAPECNLGMSLRKWRPLEPQEWRNLLAGCPGLGISFSAADCAWQNIDYLQILPGIISAIEHVEANDIEINRSLLADSGLFGPLWWRYRQPGKGQVDWRQLIEALKLYDYTGSFSVHLDDEFVEQSTEELANSLDASVTLLKPLLL